MIFESHAHYEDQRFDEDREALLLSLKEKGVGFVVNVGSSIETSKKCMALAKKYPFIKAAIGVHPSDISCLNQGAMQWLRETSNQKEVVAIGEIGLDYYWDKEEDVQRKQREWFLAQLELAAEVDLPVIIHSRDAAEDTLNILKEFHKNHPERKNPGVIHCYSYTKELAREFVKMGYYIGVGGVVTFKNAKKLVETVKELSLDSLVIETDCPYMAPEPNRGQRNDSTNLKFVVEKIAQIKGVAQEEVICITEENGKKLYRM